MAVTVASLQDIVEAMADAITGTVAAADLGGEALQVWPFLLLNPTPPCIDIYPADPFSEQTEMGPAQGRDLWWTVRARVAPAEVDAAQQLLLQLMDPRADTSVFAALIADRSLGGLVSDITPTGPSGVIVYTPIGNEGYLIGCEWRTRVLL